MAIEWSGRESWTVIGRVWLRRTNGERRNMVSTQEVLPPPPCAATFATLHQPFSLSELGENMEKCKVIFKQQLPRRDSYKVGTTKVWRMRQACSAWLGRQAESAVTGSESQPRPRYSSLVLLYTWPVQPSTQLIRMTISFRFENFSGKIHSSKHAAETLEVSIIVSTARPHTGVDFLKKIVSFSAEWFPQNSQLQCIGRFFKRYEN